MTTPANDPWRIEKVYLLPVPLRKSQFGAWWTGALDEGLVKHGDCFWPVDIWIDPDELPLNDDVTSVQPMWRPSSRGQRFSGPALSLQPGCILAFRDTEGFLLELHREWNAEPLTYFGVDARFLDERLEWKSPRSRERVLGLLSKALCERTLADHPHGAPAVGHPGALARTQALQDTLRGKR